MSVKYDRMTRRQFLIGVGGYFLVVPFLPSLLSREALAQVTTGPRRLLITTVEHNMVANQILSPSVANIPLSSGISYRTLNDLNQNLANFLTHPTIVSLKNSGLITMVRGIDNIVTPDAHGPTWLTGSTNSDWDAIYSPSIDAYLESSQTLYPTATSTGYLKKVLRCNGSISYRKVGNNVTRITDCYGDDANNNWNGAKKLYNDMVGRFSSGGGSTPPPPPPTNDNSFKNNILNLVFESYQNARNSRRISNDDKHKLDEHMERIHELQSSLVISEPPPTQIPQASCQNPFSNGNLANNAIYSYTDKMEVYMKLVRIALTCGMTKVAILNFEGHGVYDIGAGKSRFPSTSGHDFHGSIIHNEQGAYTLSERQSQYNYWMKWHMDKLSEYILEPLRTTEDVEANNGKSYLENMLVAVLSEAGVDNDGGSHVNLDYMPILFGNMGGLIRSNRFVAIDRGTSGRGTGIPYNQLLITFLKAMGLPESEYSASSNTGQGFGQYRTSGNHFQRWGHRYYQPIEEIWNG